MSPPLGMYVRLNDDELAELRRSAANNLRIPRDHARYLLRLALNMPELQAEANKDIPDPDCKKCNGSGLAFPPGPCGDCWSPDASRTISKGRLT